MPNRDQWLAIIAETRNLMRVGRLLFLTFIALPLVFAQAPPASDEYWPREVDTDDLRLVLYQPQVDSWKGNRIEARSAVIVTLKGESTQIGLAVIHVRAWIYRFWYGGWHSIDLRTGLWRRRQRHQ